MSEQPAPILVFAKSLDQPVKTRLAATRGEVAARQLYETLAGSTVRAVRDAGGPGVLLVAGDTSHASVKAWSCIYPRLEIAGQCGDDLGARMADAFARFGDAGAVLVGTDCPELSHRVIAQARLALRHADVVLVPVEDGGYVLIALRQPQPQLFAQMPWSTASVARLTVARALSTGLSVRLLPALWDVDDEADYERWLAREID